MGSTILSLVISAPALISTIYAKNGLIFTSRVSGQGHRIGAVSVGVSVCDNSHGLTV